MLKSLSGLLSIAVLLGATVAGATVASDADAPPVLRWTAQEDANASFAHVLKVLSRKTGYHWSARDFLLNEDRDLAFNHYKRYVQVVGGLPVHNRFVRIWTRRGSNATIQVEANVEHAQTMRTLLAKAEQLESRRNNFVLIEDVGLTPESTMRIARELVTADGIESGDAHVREIEWRDEWRGTDRVRAVKVRGKRGTHLVVINTETGLSASHEYREFPQMESRRSEMSIRAQVYPIYEETEEAVGQVLPRRTANLKHVLTRIPQGNGDIYAALRTRRYFASQLNPVLGSTEAGRAQGYWSSGYLKQQAAEIIAGLPVADNTYASGVLLQGRYTSINIHPDAIIKYAPDFRPEASTPFLPNWVTAVVNGQEVDEMVPSTAFAGKRIRSAHEAFNTPARRLPDHDPKEYINDGFDEIQVYYAVDTLFTELHARGWRDPELSTRPFNAFLFNPDISMRDNAFYTDDTINFTTYSAKGQNFARDNSTIWHELGHGIMDRLMGDNLDLADTGGLSEGMADFLAALVVEAVTGGKPFPGSGSFRIVNKTGFNLTNEVHDDGEAYGGTMKDFLDAAIARFGHKWGLAKVTDLVLEAMRLSRDYPGLTAQDWFNHVLFADSLGRVGVRGAGELAPLLKQALASRNFKFDASDPASFAMINAQTGFEVVAGMPGSRQRPILAQLAPEETASFEIKGVLKSSSAYPFRYPVTVQVQHNGGPLQGAIRWTDESTQTYVLGSEADVATIPLTVTGRCDEVNREDGSCVDYAYVKVFNAGESAKPVAKKRFYLRVKN